MVSIRTKGIRGKNYLYAEQSVRLLDGSVKKLSKRISRSSDAHCKEVAGYFKQQEIAANKKES